jgi:arginine/ornithine N-succinyltransferase beta subunit
MFRELLMEARPINNYTDIIDGGPSIERSIILWILLMEARPINNYTDIIDGGPSIISLELWIRMYY